jgi:alpha-glucosidase
MSSAERGLSVPEGSAKNEYKSGEVTAFPERVKEIRISSQPEFRRATLVDPRWKEIKENEPLPAWRNEVVYQIMTRSFYDSNGDGNGDLRGIIEKADFIKHMGYDTIWLNPIHKSPQKDNGYDVASYYKVDPMYGTNKDLEDLVGTMKDIGVGVHLDLVINHSSSEHAWFKRARESKDSMVRDVYVFKDGKRAEDGTIEPPNNWRSYFGGPAWTYHPETEQFYLHKFDKDQPDLNLHNPIVEDHVINKIIPRLIKMGIKGFRMDTADITHEDPTYMDAEPSHDYRPGIDTEMHQLKMSDRYMQRERSYTFLRRISEKLDESGGTLIGEINSENLDHIQDLYVKAKMHVPFNFNLMKDIADYGLNAGRLKNKLDEYMQAIPEGSCTSIVFDNHDRYNRLSEKVGENIRPLTLMEMAIGSEGGCMRFVYYGDDTGMPSGPITEDSMDDPQGRRQGLKYCRDKSRTPMPWENADNGGFSINSEAKPWLPVGDTSGGNNVKDQMADPGSMLNLTRESIKFFKQQPALLRGRYVPYQTFDEDALVFGRETQEQKCLYLGNFSDKPKLMLLPEGKARGEMLFSTDHNRPRDIVDGKIKLGPHEACVVELQQN